MISIGIIEDIAEIRDSLEKFFFLQNEILCEIAADSVESFLKQTENSKNFNLDLLLLDIELPGISGINGMHLIKERFPNLEIIMLTVYEDSDKIFRSLQAGANGYLIKTTPFPQIAQAIFDLYEGGSAMSPIIARKVIQFFSPQKAKKNAAKLTPKETEIVQYLVDGQSYLRIAELLGNSVDTIRHHIKHIYTKLHVTSKAELISKNYKIGL